MNAHTIVVWSATSPINSGPTTPPTGDIIRKEEALLVWLPSPRKESAKIVGNIIASNAYPHNRAASDTIPTSSNTNKVVITVPVAQTSNIFSARTRPIIQLPAKRPNINNPSPPKESTTEASRAFIQFCSTT